MPRRRREWSGDSWKPPGFNQTFHSLVFAGEIDRVSDFVLRRGADLNEPSASSSAHDTPFLLALRGPRSFELSYLRWLVAEGAFPDCVNDFGETALHVLVYEVLFGERTGLGVVEKGECLLKLLKLLLLSSFAHACCLHTTSQSGARLACIRLRP